MLRYILIDLDDTLFDFKRAERNAVTAALEAFGIAPSEALAQRYHELNLKQWRLFEAGKTTRQRLKEDRFKELLEEIEGSEGIEPFALALRYEEGLKSGCFFIEGAEEFLKKAARSYRLFLVSNGSEEVQRARLKSSGAEKYFDGIFVSESMGSVKPFPAFFDYCFSRIREEDPSFRREDCVIIGDSLSSDIRGGINAGIRTVWMNTHAAENDTELRPDFEVRSYAELERLKLFEAL